MYTLVAILLTVALATLVAVVCHLRVLAAVLRGDWRRGILAGLLPPYLYYRGWHQGERLGVRSWMRVWTAAGLTVVALSVFLQVQTGG